MDFLFYDYGLIWFSELSCCLLLLALLNITLSGCLKKNTLLHIILLIQHTKLISSKSLFILIRTKDKLLLNARLKTSFFSMWFHYTVYWLIMVCVGRPHRRAMKVITPHHLPRNAPQCNSQTSTKNRLRFISQYSLMSSKTISPGLIKQEIESINAVKRLIGSKHHPFRQSWALFNERSLYPQMQNSNKL